MSAGSIAKSYALVARNPAYLAYAGLAATSYAGLFAWISGASFVLQDLYGLSPLVFGFAFAGGSVGYMAGSALSARLTQARLDNVVGIGSVLTAAGGLGMLAAVASTRARR